MARITITLKDFASYSEATPATLVIEKPIAMIYGTNGSGKSTIARALRHHSNPALGPAGKCQISVTGLANPEILIYDADYVEDTFQPKEGAGIKGIFTLGKKSAEDLAAIAEAEQLLTVAQAKLPELEAQIAQIGTALDAAEVAAKEATWQIKKDYALSPLRFCLESESLLGDKGRLLTHLLKVPAADGSHSLEELLATAHELDEDNPTAKPEPVTEDFVHFALEGDPTLGAVIAPSTDSRLSPLIDRLASQNWVKEGIELSAQTQGICPFCQQTEPHDLKAELERMFDDAYESSTSHINHLVDQYTAVAASLETLASSPALQDIYALEDAGLQKALGDTRAIVSTNLGLLRSKASSPSVPVSLTDSSAEFASLRDRLDDLRERVHKYNTSIASIANSRRTLAEHFWSRMKHDYATVIAAYESERNRLTHERETLLGERAAASQDVGIKRESLATLRKDATNIESAVENINRRIQSIGLSGFAIEKDATHPGYYHIARGHQGKAAYKSLSEGEKTLVTFLYFMEWLAGSHNSNGAANKSQRIVVVDDPISSLSHNHIYDIASLIGLKIMKPAEFAQVIVLTHSLFFFHELLKVASSEKKKMQTFQVRKDPHSTIQSIQPDDLRNDYRAYWKVIADAVASGRYSVSLPIAMRYVLEHFFSFVGAQQSLEECLVELESEAGEFKPFFRYINRQSHADEININDLPAVSPELYLGKFREVFVKCQQELHFDHMIQVAAPSP